MADRRSLESSAMSRFPGLRNVLFACGLMCALAVAIPAVGQSVAKPDIAQTGAKPDAGRESPSGEGAAAVSAGPSSGIAAPAPGGSSGTELGKAATATRKAPKSAAAPDAKGGVSPFQSLGLSSEGGPIDVRSDTLDLDYKAHSVVYRGHVHATQGSASLSSDTLQVLYDGDFRELKQVVATGNVRVAQGGRWATGERADLNQVDHTVEMTGNPVIHDGPDQVAGTRILIYLDSQKSVVEKAHAVIFHRKPEDRDDQKPDDHDR